MSCCVFRQSVGPTLRETANGGRPALRSFQCRGMTKNWEFLGNSQPADSAELEARMTEITGNFGTSGRHPGEQLGFAVEPLRHQHRFHA